MVDVGDDGDIAQFFDHDVVSIDDSGSCGLAVCLAVVNSGLRAARLVGRAVADAATEQAGPFNAGDRREHWHAPR